jgi:ribokinase
MMKGISSVSQSINYNPYIEFNRPQLQISTVNPNPAQSRFSRPRSLRVLSLSADPSANRNPKSAVDAHAPPLVVVGSANADIYVEIERLPKEGETISAKTGQTLAGGKGANQAACGAKLMYPTYFVGRLGEDAHGKLIAEALGDDGCGVHLDYVRSVNNEPTGHAVVMLQSDGQNSIIIVGGANMKAWPEIMSDDDLEIVRNAGIVLLQREIPDSINIQVAKAVKKAGVPVILDVGGMDTPIPNELLDSIDILSPNETELSRLTGMPTETFEQISQAVAKCHKLVSPFLAHY